MSSVYAAQTVERVEYCTFCILFSFLFITIEALCNSQIFGMTTNYSILLLQIVVLQSFRFFTYRYDDVVKTTTVLCIFGGMYFRVSAQYRVLGFSVVCMCYLQYISSGFQKYRFVGAWGNSEIALLSFFITLVPLYFIGNLSLVIITFQYANCGTYQFSSSTIVYPTNNQP